MVPLANVATQLQFDTLNLAADRFVSPLSYLHPPLSVLGVEEAPQGEYYTSLQRSHDTLWLRLVKLGLASVTSQALGPEGLRGS